MNGDQRSVLMSSATVEHLTPDWILDLVERVAPIGLDPCGHAQAPSSLRTRTIFQKMPVGRPVGSEKFWTEGDGLKTAWAPILTLEDDVKNRRKAELAFVNPPYGRALKAWAAKMASESNTAIVALVPARVDTAWWRELDPVAWCALAGRIKFLDGAGREQDAAPFPSAVCLLHARHLLQRFVEVFSERGPVYERISKHPACDEFSSPT